MSFKIRGRFSDDKQDQIEQLISYATMLGLTGTDLVAIGGKMDREKKKANAKMNLELIKSVEIFRIGQDIDTEKRFKIKTPSGSYNFENNGWDTWKITSLATKTSIFYTTTNNIDLPTSSWQRLHHQRLLYDVATGAVKLNF